MPNLVNTAERDLWMHPLEYCVVNILKIDYGYEEECSKYPENCGYKVYFELQTP